MIKSLTVTNYLGESIKLELRFPEKSGFLVQSIDGLGPANSSINISEMATNDGGKYNSARCSTRNIVLSLKLLDVPSIETVRQKTYKYFPIKKPLTIAIETDNRVCYATGYVESNEPDIFSKWETTQISIVCPDPYFYSVNKTVTVFSGKEPSFEFPFSNESLTDDKIIIGEIKNETEETVFYRGDSEVGVFITIHAIGLCKNITIFNTGTREKMFIDTAKIETLTGSHLIAGDDVYISSVKGDKFVTLFRNGVYTNILNCVSRDSDWFNLTKGDNIFAYSAIEGSEYLQFKIENRIVYEGV